jgi:hypothetical protein
VTLECPRTRLRRLYPVTQAFRTERESGDAFPQPSMSSNRVTQSNAFTDSSDGSPMSMSATLVVEGGEVESYLRATAAKEGTGVVELSVSYLRGLGLQVVRSADPTGRDPSHVSVIGEKTKSVQRALAKGATWILRPTAPRGG